ncbi:MAG: HDOD domain-containing protein, partial [Nitrospinae bacterium]|nr:HDOD domain-containing protein [Nitrospinota bacterium]
IAVAVAAKMMAKPAGVNRLLYEEYFIAGLLHDIGKVIFMTFFTEHYDKLLGVLQKSEKSLEVLEKEKTGLNHCEIGEYMAIQWKLPPILQKIIKNHHIMTPIDGEESQHGITVLADIAAHRAGFGEIFVGKSEDALQYPSALLECTKLTKEQVLEIEEKLPEELEKAKILLTL